MKKILIISPHFPPINAPDMHRVRMSLPYYLEQGWDPTVLTVDDKHIVGFRDDLLIKTIPPSIRVIKVGAFPIEKTSKFGLGSLSLRSLWHFYKEGTSLLKQEKFDLIFFSTTMFHVCFLGRIWKKKYKIPFIMDMQDPWRNDYYLNKPKDQRPPKFWLAYNLNKFLESLTLPYVDGLISVSEAYITSLRKRYKALDCVKSIVIPFGASEIDLEIAKRSKFTTGILKDTKDKINIVYTGAVTPFFIPVIKAFFIALLKCNVDISNYHFYFVGTNYVKGVNRKQVYELAKELNIEKSVTEITDRITYFEALLLLCEADKLFIPGSVDASYNASKVYNNILSGTPIFSIFHDNSLVKKVIEETEAGVVVSFTNDDSELLIHKIQMMIPAFLALNKDNQKINQDKFLPYTAKAKTVEQILFFNEIIRPL